MLDSTFSCIFDAATGITVSAFLICVIAALALGIIMAAAYLWRNICTSGYAAAVAMLPAIVCVVIMMVGGSLGAGVAVAGTFSLVRFRSAPGTAREICGIFLAVAVGLACGMGYPGLAVLFAVIMVAAGLALGFMHFGEKKATGFSGCCISRSRRIWITAAFSTIFSRNTPLRQNFAG